MLGLIEDLRFALRTLAKAPGFTAVVVGTLALGIGVNVAIFSFISAAMFAPPPFPDPHELVRIWRTGPTADEGRFTADVFHQYRERLRSFESLGALDLSSRTLTQGDEPVSVMAAIVSPSTMELLEVEPAIGRGFAFDAADETAMEQVVILSHRLWQRQFASDPNVVGKTIRLGDQQRTVIGVMPPEYDFNDLWMGADLWLPETFEIGGREHFEVIGRIRDGVTRNQAAAELALVAGQIEKGLSSTNPYASADIASLKVMGDNSRNAMIFLTAAVGFVLLIACANVANMLASRAVTRRPEIALRLALGAGRRRVMRQLLTESVLLACIGGAAALLLTSWGLDLLSTERLQVSLDSRALGYAFSLSLLTGVVIGFAPALEAFKANLTHPLKQGGRHAGGRQGRRLRGTLVALQVACALALSIAAAIMVNSFIRLQSIDPGFDTRNLMTLRISLRRDIYKDQSQWAPFFQQAMQRVREVPGMVDVAAFSEPLVNSHGFSSSFYLADDDDGARSRRALLAWISPNGFEFINQPMLRGRPFSEHDTHSAPPIVVVNRTFARRYFADDDPVGRQILIPTGSERVPTTIIGVVADLKAVTYGAALEPTMYVPLSQMPSPYMHLVVRTTSGSDAVSTAVRQAVRSVDANQPVSEIHAVDHQLIDVKEQTLPPLMLIGALAVLGLALASAGIYGVVAYSVAQRTHEIGVRMALGARRADVVQLVIMTQLKWLTAGVVIGLAAALAMTHALAEALYHVSPTDPLTFVLVPVLLALVALLASYAPTSRAARLDPAVVLRDQ